MAIRLKVDDLEIPETNPFEKCALKREAGGEILTQFVTCIAEPYVLAVNGEWGSGKTTFVKMWNQHLKNEGFETLYFNAWETDFSADPFVSLASELSDSLEHIAGIDSGLAKKVRGAAVNVAKRAIPVATRLATYGLLSLDATSEKEIASVLGDITTDRIKDYSHQKESISQFRQRLQDAVVAANSDKPLIFFVDELDRCRPTYAIELLEQAKHLFSVPGIVFVLSIDREQLQHSIKAVYGDRFDAARYLRRFIDMDYLLQEPTRGTFVPELFSRLGLTENLARFGGRSSSRLGLEDMIEELVACFRLSLREQIQLLSRINVVLSTVPGNYYLFEIELALLAFLREFNPKLYGDFSSGIAGHDEFVEYLESNSTSGRLLKERIGAVVRATIAIGADHISNSSRSTDAYRTGTTDLDKRVTRCIEAKLNQLHHSGAMIPTIDRINLTNNFVSSVIAPEPIEE